MLSFGLAARGPGSRTLVTPSLRIPASALELEPKIRWLKLMIDKIKLRSAGGN